MANDGDGQQGAKALPSKRFFVNMLVRDIELKDAILDLLDNCVDGILRSRRPDLSQAKPYAGCRAAITLSADGFRIIDNCGGIPFDVAKNKAFAIGNPNPITGEDAAATVGMYGIGMKRAIFKFGESAIVRSYSDRPFEVRIDRNWLGNDAWTDLPMVSLEEGDFTDKGTMVEVRDLYTPVAAEFDRDSFVEDVREAIASQYSIILGKGFEVTIARRMDGAAKAVPVEAEKFQLLAAPDEGQPHIAPYVYKGEIDGVAIEIYAGLYRELPDETEQEEAEETSGSADDAGWVVACNDRVVIWKDRSRLTGWGEAGTPNFHGQFIAITGIVLMHSTDPSLLPLTTTKRGVDAGSEVYSKVKDLMRTATQGLASFTNKWKKFPADLDQLYLKSEALDLPTLQARAPAMRVVHNMPTMQRAAPTLPMPAAIVTDARISFAAPKTKVAQLAEIYFGDRNAKASKVGERAFHQEYARLAEAAE